MPYEIKVLDQWMTIRFFGVMTAQELSDYTAELEMVEASQERTLDRLTDLTETVESPLDSEAIYTMATRRTVAAIRNPIKSAIVAPTPLHYGFGRMFQTLNENPLIEIELFHDLDSALAWLRSRETASAEGSELS